MCKATFNSAPSSSFLTLAFLAEEEEEEEEEESMESDSEDWLLVTHHSNELDMELEFAVWREAHPESWGIGSPLHPCFSFFDKPNLFIAGMGGLLWVLHAKEDSYRICNVHPQHLAMEAEEITDPVTELEEDEEYISFRGIKQVEGIGQHAFLCKETVESASTLTEVLDCLFHFSLWYVSCCQYEDHHDDAPLLEAEDEALMACKRASEACMQVAEAAEVMLCETVLEEVQNHESDGRTQRLCCKAFCERAIREGDVLQWCSISRIEKAVKYVECKLNLEDFMEKDEEIENYLGIDLGHPIWVRIFGDVRNGKQVLVRVIHEINGTQACSLGTEVVLPQIVKQYLDSSCRSNGNPYIGLLQHLAWYLTFLKQICIVCLEPISFTLDSASVTSPRSWTCPDKLICQACLNAWTAALNSICF